MAGIQNFEPLWGVWKTEKQLGKGSFGSVYLARRTDAPDFCSAIKHLSIPADANELRTLIEEGVAADVEGARAYYEKLRDDIIGEIRFMYRLRDCRNIVAYEDHAVIEKKGMPGFDIFIRMELLEPLTKRVSDKPLSQEEVCRLGIDICTALEALEKERIIHRDVKPANILVAHDGTCKLGDFGVARQMEKTCMVMSKKGTYSYMAPEVYRGEEAGRTADIYSLGLVMHRLLNGNRAPFLPPEGAVTYQDMEIALAKRLAGKELPYPAYAGEAVGAVIGRACAFKPRERFSSAAAMRLALMRCIDPAAHGESAETVPWESSSMEDSAYSTASPRESRIKTIRDGDALLAASLKEKYVWKKKRKNIKLLIWILAAVIMAILAIIFIWLPPAFMP